VFGPILVCQIGVPVAASSAYRKWAPDAYTVDTPVTGSGSTAAVAVIPRLGQVSSRRLHTTAPVDSFSA